MKRALDAIPPDAGAEERAWAIVREAYARREPAVRRRSPVRPAFVLAAAAVVALAAAALSAPGRAVVNAVRKSIGIEGSTGCKTPSRGSGREARARRDTP